MKFLLLNLPQHIVDEVFVIAIGSNVDDAELNDIATDPSHVTKVTRFEDLLHNYGNVVGTICERK